MEVFASKNGRGDGEVIVGNQKMLVDYYSQGVHTTLDCGWVSPAPVIVVNGFNVNTAILPVICLSRNTCHCLCDARMGISDNVKNSPP